MVAIANLFPTTIKNESAIIYSNFAVGVATWRARRNVGLRVVFESGSLTPLCENMTLSTKPEEVCNTLHCDQTRTEPRPHVEHLQKIMWSLDMRCSGARSLTYESRHTDRHADRQTKRQTRKQTHRNTSLTYCW